MNEATKQLIAGITIALKGGSAGTIDGYGEDGFAEFRVGTTMVRIDPKGISVTFHEEGCDPVELRIDRPNVEIPTAGGFWAGGAGSSISGSAGMAHAVGAGSSTFKGHCVTVSSAGVTTPKSERVTIKAIGSAA